MVLTAQACHNRPLASLSLTASCYIAPFEPFAIIHCPKTTYSSFTVSPLVSPLHVLKLTPLFLVSWFVVEIWISVRGVRRDFAIWMSCV